MKYSGGPLDNQTWQTEWKTASLAKVQVCEYENKFLMRLAVCTPSLIVQWLTGIFHFYLLRMIVKLAYRPLKHNKRISIS